MLHLLRDEPTPIDIDDLLGERIAVLGMSGQGKSNTAAVLCEELLAAGLPLAIIDTAGEYWGLKEKYPILIAGQSAQADIEIAPTQTAPLADLFPDLTLSTLLDTLVD